ncbi:hypothetical protein ATCC90586_007436 [Pythium insidiosum]|nr:hypothetical protein ATCC90586_007436 [Pythium insidiosum]
MQNPNANSGGYGSFHANDADADLPTSLPSYMPPNPPPHHAQPQPQVLPYGFDLLGRAQLAQMGKPDELPSQFASASISTPGSAGGDGGGGMPTSAKRQAPVGQWKTPPHFLYAAAPAPQMPTGMNAAAPAMMRPPPQQLQPKSMGRPGRDSGQPSPSTGMRGMSFQDQPLPAAQSASSSGDEMKPMPTKEIGGISAAQFAASTGGLTMDATLLARVSGTDPSLMGSEEIKQIMRCPDLLSIYQKLQEEDDRRQRRLERNRASARVRREKKKNMVETYEGEVSKLENSLNLLRSHSFGAGQAQDLLSALDYTGGEHLRHALMSKEAKTDLMGRILGQHSRNTQAIRRANMENQVLLAAACENSELFSSLRTQLRLSDEQVRQLQSLAPRARDEARKLDAIAKCFSALRVHDWLYFPGIESLLHHTRNTMTHQQFQKFLTWTNDNRDVIESLQVIAAAAPGAENDLEFMFAED